MISYSYSHSNKQILGRVLLLDYYGYLLLTILVVISAVCLRYVILARGGLQMKHKKSGAIRLRCHLPRKVLNGTPKGIRTPVVGVKGRCPRPG